MEKERRKRKNTHIISPPFAHCCLMVCCVVLCSCVGLCCGVVCCVCCVCCVCFVWLGLWFWQKHSVFCGKLLSVTPISCNPHQSTQEQQEQQDQQGLGLAWLGLAWLWKLWKLRTGTTAPSDTRGNWSETTHEVLEKYTFSGKVWSNCQNDQNGFLHKPSQAKT